MTKASTEPGNSWPQAELDDAFDEDYELELGEIALSGEIAKSHLCEQPASLERGQYFRHLLELQRGSGIILLKYWFSISDEEQLNCMAHLLQQIPYQEVPQEVVALPERQFNPNYERHERPSRSARSRPGQWPHTTTTPTLPASTRRSSSGRAN